MLNIRRDTEGVVKAAIVVMLILGAIGAGWMYVQLDEDLTLGVRIVNADFSQEDGTIPMTVEVKCISTKPEDIHITYINVELFVYEGGPRITHLQDFDITIPAGGEVLRSFDIVLENTNSIDDHIYVMVEVHQDTGPALHYAEDVDLNEYSHF